MKKTAILGIILIIALVACAPAEKPAEMEKEEVAKEPVMEEKAPVEEKAPAPAPEPEVGRTPPKMPAPQPVSTEPKAEMSPQLRDLIKRADEKLSSLQYLYGGTLTGNLFLDTYYVKGDKMKIGKYEESYYVREGYYDTVYVDLGYACCEELKRCKSHNVDNTGKKFDVDVSMLNIPKTPYQWIKEVPASAVIVGPQTFNQRSVTFIKYTKDGSEVEMWVDDTYGVPHKIVVKGADGSEVRHQYNDMLFNGLKDSDFQAPC